MEEGGLPSRHEGHFGIKGRGSPQNPGEPIVLYGEYYTWCRERAIENDVFAEVLQNKGRLVPSPPLMLPGTWNLAIAFSNAT